MSNRKGTRECMTRFRIAAIAGIAVIARDRSGDESIHFHLILTPALDVPLEKALQYIQGGFSFHVKKELGFASLVWEESFTNHRIRDAEDMKIIGNTSIRIL